jgi:hypothetical protein
MLIEWRIHKRAGHLRPKLHYQITLEPFEIALAVPMASIASTIPKPPDAGQYYVWPGTKECGKEAPMEVYELCTPSHQTRCRKETVTLPMRNDNAFPEVEESFTKLREAYERVLLKAYENSAFETRGRMELSLETKRRIAPAAAAVRFLEALDKAS